MTKHKIPETLFLPFEYQGEECIVKSVSNDGSVAEVMLPDGLVKLAKVLK